MRRGVRPSVRRAARRSTGRSVRRRARGARPGFTLAELVFAVVLLGGVLLGFAALTQRFVRAGAGADLRSAASDCAVDRVEAAKALTSYDAIAALAGTEAAAARPCGAAGYTRRTAVRRTQTAEGDFRTVTVTVTHPALPAPVSKTTAVAAF